MCRVASINVHVQAMMAAAVGGVYTTSVKGSRSCTDACLCHHSHVVPCSVGTAQVQCSALGLPHLTAHMQHA